MDLNYEQMTSKDILNSLTAAGGDNPVMKDVLRKMVAKLAEAKGAYFRKPVAHVPVGATTEVATRVMKSHPEIRELIFANRGTAPDAQFVIVKHLAVRRLLLGLLSSASALVEDPYAQQVVLCGVVPVEHQFVFRTQVPLVDIITEEPHENLRQFVVADLVKSKYSLSRLLNTAASSDVAELLLVTPYDPRMWDLSGGHQLDGGYVFEWAQAGTTGRRNDITKPVYLPSKFFSDAKFRAWNLYVQPYGSAEAWVVSRDEYVMLFSGKGRRTMFQEVRTVRNGFAEVSFIKSQGCEEVDTELTRKTQVARAIPDGMVEVPRLAADTFSEIMSLGRHFDLVTDQPLYVRATFLEKAVQQFFRLKLGREVIPAMVRSLHANSARMVYNGAVVTSELMVDVEAMCVVLEHVVTTMGNAKARLGALSAQAKVPMHVRPVEYAAAMLQWAAARAVKSGDIVQGAKDVVDFLSGDDSVGAADSVGVGRSGQLAGVVYGPPSVRLDASKEFQVDRIAKYSEDTFLSTDMPYAIERQGLRPDKADTFSLRMVLHKYGARHVDIGAVQTVYDSVFPGNSMIDPTMVQVAAEQGNAQFIIDVQYFRTSIPLMFSSLEGYQVVPSRLRTSVGADLMGSFRSLMGSLMKRNFNRPRPEAAGSRRLFVEQSVNAALSRFGVPEKGQLLAAYQQSPITVSRQVIELWAGKHPVADVLAAATMLDMTDPDPSRYRLMPKDIPKPSMSLDSQGAVMAGQTVVYHSKDIVSITAGAFTVIISRLLALFETNVAFAFGADENTSGLWADRYLDMPDTYVYEIDVPKFDKSQDWVCFELILFVMELMGTAPDLVAFWRKASDQATVFSSLFALVFSTTFGNRSGSGATLATNCIVLLFAYMSSFSDMDVLAILIKGDDSVLVTRRPMEEYHKEYLLQQWGFTMKLVGRQGVVTFCSSVFVKNADGNYHLVRDPLRVIEKMGRALPVNKPASYFLDYYISVVDTARQYDDDIIVANLQLALTRVYGVPVDVATLCRFIQYVSSGTDVFLRHLYGLSKEQIVGLSDIDVAVESIAKSRSSRYVKGKDMIDEHSRLKLSLVKKIMSSNDWIYDAA